MKKILFFTAILFQLTNVVNQTANGQSCDGNKVLISKGCVCGTKKGSCQSKCVDPSQVAQFESKGWYLGMCSSDCCPPIKIQQESQPDSAVANNFSKLPVVHNELTSDFHCDCLLADFGCKKNQKCYRYCVRFCFPMLSNTGETAATNSSSFFLIDGKALSMNFVDQSIHLDFNSSWIWKDLNSTQYRADFISAEGKRLEIR